MEIPKFHETFIPILKVLENGETLQAREMYQKVIDQFYSELSKEKLEEKTKYDYRITYILVSICMLQKRSQAYQRLS